VPAAEEWEYHAVVTNSAEDIVAVQDLYRQRADVENAYDELKNQWGWGGFTTRDLLRCQVSARNVALVYNWWSLKTPDLARETGGGSGMERRRLQAGFGFRRKAAGRTKSTHAASAAPPVSLRQRRYQS
jgi:Transposase DDE domain